MATVPRYFTPSTTGRGLDKRREHIMISGGREGPEIAMKPPRTDRYSEQGSQEWSAELESDKTRPEARTQPPFLRGIQTSERAYRRGTMTVAEMLDVGNAALERARGDSSFVPRVEYTGITAGGDLAAVNGTLIDADVDTLSQQSVADWDAALGQLAADLKSIELRVGVAPPGETRVDYMAPVRVYLGLSGSDRAVPVSQMAVVPSATGGGMQRRGMSGTITGVYTPGESDEDLKYKGKVLQAGEPISIASSLVEYVSVDPPKYRTQDYVNSPGFARSRGFVIELDPEMSRRIGSPPLGRVTVPYSTVLRLRVIHPPASGGWKRRSSSAIEDTKTIQREIEGASRHLARVRDALVLRARSLATRPEKAEQVSYRDRATGLFFGLADTSVRGLASPTVVWRSVRVAVPGKDVPLFYPPAGEASLIGREVTPVDLLRVIRAEAASAGLSRLRSAEARRGAPLQDYRENPKRRRF